ncbi:MAG: hypothetical protein R3B09_16695 [Nannocystaceae bacterium]
MKGLRIGYVLPLALACFGCSGGDDGREDTDPSATASISTSGGSNSATESTDGTTGDTTASTSKGSTGTDSVGESETAGTTVGTTTSMTTTDTTASTTTNSTTDGGDGTVIELKIDPLDPIVIVNDGVIPPPLVFTAVGVTDKNVEVPIAGKWDYDRFDLAAMDANTGEFVATGNAGGVGKVTFTAQNLQAETTATVKLVFTNDPDGVDPGIKKSFDDAVDPDPSMKLLYPYDKTVFPRGLTGPVIQWEGGNADDIYHLHAVSPYFEFESWTKQPPPSRFAFPTMPADVWVKLTDSTEGPITVDIARYDGQKAYLVKTQTWTIAPANLTGTVYYWEVNNGNIVRLNVGDMAPQSFIQKDGNTQCLACHSVSKDGSRIVAGAQGGWSPWTTINSSDGALLYYSAQASGFEAISPNGSHVIWGQSSEAQALKLSTYNSNAVLGQLSVPGGWVVHPAWAGDSTHVAFAQRTDGNWLDFNHSHLWITEVDLNNNTFGNTIKLVDSGGGLPTVTFPTFSPDSQWIAFMRANQARTRAAQAEVWLTNTDGTSQIHLANANGLGIIEPGQDQTTYEPTFLPVSVGGYFWLIIGSERKYGNTLTDTNPNSRRKQLWVSAIDINIQDGVDPSHPPFWLPGQELNNSNMRGEWALSPCKTLGESCMAGFDCCDGFCVDDGMGVKKCGDKPEMGCSEIGDSCELDASCCEGECQGGFCAIVPG